MEEFKSIQEEKSILRLLWPMHLQTAQGSLGRYLSVITPDNDTMSRSMRLEYGHVTYHTLQLNQIQRLSHHTHSDSVIYKAWHHYTDRTVPKVLTK